MSDEIRVQFTRFSAFYTPLIATIAGGFLKDEGFAPKHSVAPAGTSAVEGLVKGTVHVCQSAPSQNFGPLEKGQRPPAMHFAQINEKDGFFLTGRAPDPSFTWDKLRGKRVLVDHGGQPLAMFKYACHRRGSGLRGHHGRRRSRAHRWMPPSAGRGRLHPPAGPGAAAARARRRRPRRGLGR